MKKIISFLLAVILIFTFCAPAFAMAAIGKVPPIAGIDDRGDIGGMGDMHDKDDDMHDKFDIENPSSLPCIPSEGKIKIKSGNFYISENCEIDELSISSGCSLKIPEGITLTVKGTFENSGTVELLGTLDIKECSVKNGVDKINIGDKGNLILDSQSSNIDATIFDALRKEDFATTVSDGDPTVITAVIAVAVVAVLIIIKKKKKKIALSESDDKTL